MADTFLDEVVQGNAPSRASKVQTAPVELVEGEGGRAKPTAPPAAAPANETSTGDDIPVANGRALPQSVREKFAAIAAARAAESPSEVDEDPDAPAGETAAEVESDPDAPPGEAAKPAAAKVEAAPAADDPVAKLQAEIAKRDEANRQLYEEFETYKKKPATIATADKLLKEAATSYLDNEQDSLRKFVAASLGVEDPNAPEVTAELRDLYSDWTAKELGVTPDAAHQAKRDAARTRRQWEREKRERKAEEQSKSSAPVQDEQAKQNAEAAPYIGTKLASKSADYPLLTALAQKLNGVSPELMVAQTIRREIRTGRLDKNLSDDDLIAAAAKHAESQYQALRDMFAQASPTPSTQPSTAQPNGKPSTAASSARPDTRQSHGARTLTAADASVAPATPPAKKPAKKDDERPPPGSSPEVVQKWAMRHLRKPRK
jgi:hypothetical protein